MEPLITLGIARKLSLTGSTGVGKVLMKRSAEKVLRTSRELGGNAPFLVFEDADLDKAVTGCMQAKMRSMGEACTAANRIYVHSSVMDALVQDAVDGGARVHTGGKRPSGLGYYYPPTVLTGVSASARMANEEIFGPVAALISFETEDEAVPPSAA